MDLNQIAQEYNIPFMPGAITPAEIMRCQQCGLTRLKFFPAESFNGLAALKSYQAVFPEIRFCATGGISLDNMASYLNLTNVMSIGCSFLADPRLIADGAFAQLTDLAKHALELANQIK